MSIIKNLLGYAAAEVIIKASETVNNHIIEANRPCTFTGEISDYEFNAIVRYMARGLDDIYELNVVGSVVTGKIGGPFFSEKRFNIDFNDCGKLTGKYKISGCKDEIVTDFASAVSEKIKSINEGHGHMLNWQIRAEEDRYFKSVCPYCNKEVSADCKRCPNCGKLLRI